jgi:hypothetical protein
MPPVHLQDIPNDESKSLREIDRLKSITGGQKMLKYDYKEVAKQTDASVNKHKCYIIRAVII